MAPQSFVNPVSNEKKTTSPFTGLRKPHERHQELSRSRNRVGEAAR
jgi:hypothetical protein